MHAYAAILVGSWAGRQFLPVWPHVFLVHQVLQGPSDMLHDLRSAPASDVRRISEHPISQHVTTHLKGAHPLKRWEGMGNDHGCQRFAW